ncbi:reverse transcriptase domain-containing protein [Tanacetum coccineum]
MLGEHNITYRLRISVKGQILADFLAEKPDDAPPEASVIETPPEPWTLFTDGSSYYEALIAGLGDSGQMGERYVHAGVSHLQTGGINQVLGTFVAKDPKSDKGTIEKAKSLISGFASFSISQVLVEVLKEKSIQEREVAIVVEEEGPRWMTSIIEYLRDETLPDNRKEANKLHIKARQYELLEGILYRRSFLKPWLSLPFGLPGEIVSDNSKQFSGDSFKDWCEKLNIVQRFALVKHPQSNGLVERANRSLGEGIKARLGEGNKNWLEELPHVIWAHRTMIKSSNDDTPFSPTYGTEAVIPAKIRMQTYRTAVVDAVHNDEELQLNLDLLEERRERVAIREAKAKLNMTKYYNARIRGVTSGQEDCVYRSIDDSHAVGWRETWFRSGKELGNLSSWRCLIFSIYQSVLEPSTAGWQDFEGNGILLKERSSSLRSAMLEVSKCREVLSSLLGHPPTSPADRLGEGVLSNPSGLKDRSTRFCLSHAAYRNRTSPIAVKES